MSIRSMIVGVMGVCSLFLGQATGVRAQDAQATPQMFGLGDNKNVRTAEPSEIRVYKTKSDGKTADRTAGLVWPRPDSEDKTQYKLKDNEAAVYHGAIDLSSRGPDGKPVAREFTAGVYGTLLASRPGFVAVQMADGNIVQYLHASGVRLKPGQEVKPDSILGETGNLGTTGKPISGMAIHLHIQVSNPKGELVDPDRAILAARAEKQDRTIKWSKPDWVDAGPTLIDSVKPKVSSDGIVKADATNKKLYYDESAPKSAAKSVRPTARLDPPKLPETCPCGCGTKFGDCKMDMCKTKESILQKYRAALREFEEMNKKD
jgi:murein DD-endopeptidase MepM/ murein hydrolase activator NlpD